MVVVFNPSILGFGEDEPVYQPIGFDASQTRWYAQELVNLGHPEWEGRMSGSPEEAAGAQMILDNLTEMGYSPQLNTYPVPMFAINSAPILSMCIPLAGGLFGAPVTGASCNSVREPKSPHSNTEPILFCKDIQVLLISNLVKKWN